MGARVSQLGRGKGLRRRERVVNKIRSFVALPFFLFSFLFFLDFRCL